MNNVNIAKRQSYHHGHLRAALVRAGVRAVAESGVAEVKLRDIARRVGVTAPAVYRHFADREALLAAVAGEVADRFFEALEQAVARAGDNVLARFRAAGIAHVQFAVAHPEHFRLMTASGLFEMLPADYRARIAAWNARQRDDLIAAQRAGDIADIAIDELLLAANALVQGLAHMIIAGELGDVTPERARELAIAVTGAFGVGLLPRAHPVGDPMRPHVVRKR